jgi:hypothetical protein
MCELSPEVLKHNAISQYIALSWPTEGIMSYPDELGSLGGVTTRTVSPLGVEPHHITVDGYYEPESIDVDDAVATMVRCSPWPMKVVYLDVIKTGTHIWFELLVVVK